MALRWISKLEAHAQRDDAQFAELRNTLKVLEARTEARHEENRSDMAALKTDVSSIGASVAELVRMRPELEEGVLADRIAKQRRAALRKILFAVMSTATFTATALALGQAIWNARPILTFHFGG